MNLTTWSAIGYGILAGGGGILGYAKSRSQISLISGLASGILLILGGIAHQQNLNWGLPLSVVVTVALILTFIIRLTKTRTFMPAGLMIVAGILVLLGLTA